MGGRTVLLTGKLAEKPLSKVVKGIPDVEVISLGITVAAFMTTEYIAKNYRPSESVSRVIVSGKCKNVDVVKLSRMWNINVQKGPEDLKDVPLFLSGKGLGRKVELDKYDIKIFAEIVDAPLLSFDEILEFADYYHDSGADIIDIGCIPGDTYTDVGKVVKTLKNRGYTVSIDTFDIDTIRMADDAGVDYVLSLNSRNMELASSLNACPIIVPDFGELKMDSLVKNVELFRSIRDNKKFIVDPVISPFNVGFVDSILRYHRARRLFPDVEILMGIGNLTELTDGDSTGLNMALVSIAQELGVKYVLTTEVVNWARGSVREVDIARRISYHSFVEKLPPKNVSTLLVSLKDPPFGRFTIDELRSMQQEIRDKNWRIFVSVDGKICVFNREKFIVGTDIQVIFKEMDVVEPSHAFYLGRELQKAKISLILSKNYVQDKELRWGYLYGEEG